MTELRALRDAAGNLERRLRDDEAARDARLGDIHPDYRLSARNFVDYITIRQTDLRPRQLGLVRHGLSSLGRLEGHVLDALTRVRERLDDAIARGNAMASGASPTAATPTWEESNRLLHEHTRGLLGPRPSHRHVYVMVTAPNATEVDESWVERLLETGMNVLRVNTAHENQDAWMHIVSTARRVAGARKVHLHIAVDLPGPKLRTMMLQEGPRVVKWKPVRDDFGGVVTPCKITLHARSGATIANKTTLSVSDSVWPELGVGDVLGFRDARGKHRELTITPRGDNSATAELLTTAYIVPGTIMTQQRGDQVHGEMKVESVPSQRLRLALAVGEAFWLVKPGVERPAGMKAIACTLDAGLAALEINHRVLFDDGRLEAIVEQVATDHAVLRVTYAAGGSFKLAGEKGINLPDTELALPLFSVDDEQRNPSTNGVRLRVVGGLDSRGQPVAAD